jgi:hypothetical protein
MAITDFSTYTTKRQAPYQSRHTTKNSLTTVAGQWYSLWATAPLAGAAPTTAAVPTNATTGALEQGNSATTLRVLEYVLSLASGGMLVLCDRLSHQGGLSGTTTTAQTTNLPTAALTRYTTGAIAAYEIYTIIGTTATTITASYTNQAGTTGRTTLASVFGATNNREVGRLIPFTLQQGDTAVQAVASATVLATTGIAGNFGITIFKPLVALPILAYGSAPRLLDALLDLEQIPDVQSDACLFWAVCAQTTASGVLQACLQFAED